MPLLIMDDNKLISEETPTSSPLIPDQLDQPDQSNQADQYQKILAEYSNQISNQPAPSQPQSSPSSQLPPSPSPTTSIPVTPTQTSINTDKKFSFFKYLFYLTTIIFVIVLVLLLKDYLRLMSLTSKINSNQAKVEPIVNSDQSTCLYQEQTFQLGEVFIGDDGCSQCTCQATETSNQVVCNSDNCANQPSVD